LAYTLLLFKHPKNNECEKEMVQSDVTQKQSFFGEIIEIVDKGGQQFAKVQLKPSYIQVVIEDFKEAHLGDHIKIDAELVVEGIKLDLNNK
jgi:hypothetical protein